jgi:signal transduction histidine kinase/DNA-binding response OmpR family regulator
LRPKPDQLREYREYPVLYVDDEPENLRIFDLTFRREFSILTARSGEEGLEAIANKPVALVLSDHRMPGMTGTEFLARVAEIDPKTIRIMVTAYGDVETLQNAINDGHIYRYIPKPWTPDDVRVTLRRGIETYALEREREQLLHELTLLNHISLRLSQELELDRLMEQLLRTLTDEMGYDGAGVMFLESKDQVLRWAALAPKGSEVNERLRALRITSEGAGGFLRRLRSGQPQLLHIEDVLDYEGPVRQWVTEVAAEEVLVSPLFGKRGVFGALVVDNRRGGPRLATDDRTLIEGLCGQAGVAIDNARLVEDLRRSREQVRRADRLGTLGTLAAGLAHEINNPLVSINTFLEMAPAKRHENDEEFWGDYHKLACREVERIRGLVETMRRLGVDGGGSSHREPVDPTELVDEVVTLMRREAELSRVALDALCAPDTPKIMAVRDQVHQVVLNLVLNGLAATPAGGQVMIRTCADEAGLRLEVEDTGAGISPENLEQIFDPFFTTKGPDRGSGLGLMVCHRIVSDHAGTIEVRSRPGQGSTFIVRLPLDPAEPPPGLA